MRHVTGRVGNVGSNQANSTPLDTDNANRQLNDDACRPASTSLPHDEATEPRQSLRALLPQSRFFSGTDIHYSSIATSIETASTGDLVTYRVAQGCPLQFTADALALGVAGILTEQMLPCPLPQCIVGDIDLALAEIASIELGRPDRRVLTIGVIGSAGKTSTSLMIAGVLRSAGVRTAYQTDLGECDGIVQSTPQSTIPVAGPLIEWLAEAVESQCGAAIVEMNDTSLAVGHYDSIEIDVLVVTGPASETGNFGPSALTCALDRLAGDGVVITPVDDPRIERTVRESGARMVTYGTRRPADVTAKIIDQSGGMTTLLVSHDDTTAAMETALCGNAMASCLCAAATVGLLIDQPLPNVVESLGQIRQLPGRMQPIHTFDHPSVYLDVAGCPKRLTLALRATKSLRQGRVSCVLALSGEESSVELAEYGRVLERFADHVVLTCHPSVQSEFLQLAHSVLDGVQHCAAIRWVANWKTAIEWTVEKAGSRDTVLVAGGIARTNPHDERRDIETLQSWVQAAIDKRTVKTAEDAPQLKIFG